MVPLARPAVIGDRMAERDTFPLPLPSMRTTQALQVVRVRDLVRTGEVGRSRERAGLSKREVAGAIDVSPSTVMRWERGERVPHASEGLRYLALLDALAAQNRERVP